MTLESFEAIYGFAVQPKTQLVPSTPIQLDVRRKKRMEQKQSRMTFQVLDVSCIQCVIGIRGLLEKRSGVIDIKVNEVLNIFYVDYDPEKISEEEIEKTVKKIGYKTVKLRSMREKHMP